MTGKTRHASADVDSSPKSTYTSHMSATQYIQSLPAHDIVRYVSGESYHGKSTPFEGAPRKHPYDSQRILLIPSPFENPHVIYEFLMADVLHAEELQSVVTEKGDNLQIIRLWIRNESVGLKMEPFRVEPKRR